MQIMCQLFHAHPQKNRSFQRLDKDGFDGLYVPVAQQGQQKVKKAPIWLRHGSCRMGHLRLFFQKSNQQYKMIFKH